MSSATFDPNNFRVEDLFRAKDERRHRLAKLPFEEKIKIVKRLQAGVSAAMKNERLIFDSFLKVCPDFADERIEDWDVVENWYARRPLESPPHPFDKRPDVIAVTASGRRIGVELKSWVNRDQITEARKQERIQENILKAIGEQPPNETQHIGYVRLSAKQVRFDANDAADFRAQIFALIEREDNDWSHKPSWLQKSEHRADLNGFASLQKYLSSVHLEPATRSRFPDGWILFPSPGRAYSPNEMRETLASSLISHRSDERYEDLRTRVGLDEVYLLIHYDFKAFAYNTPFGAPEFGFEEAAKYASEVLAGNGGNFDRVFLFHFLWGEELAYKIV